MHEYISVKQVLLCFTMSMSSGRVSLCHLTVELVEDSEEGKRSTNKRECRVPGTVTVETYASKTSGAPPPQLLPVPVAPQPADQENETEADCEELDFFFGNPLVEVTKGILHLYKENELTDASKEAPSRTLCLLAVPATVSCRDLLAFMAACHRDIQHVRILRDSSQDRYMALITFRSRGAAFEFRETFGGTAYTSLEPGAVCHAAWVRKVDCFASESTNGPPIPVSTTELPTCPVCLERMDESVEGLLTVQCSHSFHSSCLTGWRDGSCPVCRCAQSPDPPAASECAQCVADGVEISPDGGALWICLICGHIGCGRYQAGHAAQHFESSSHTYALQLGTNRVWDYAGDNFVHRLLQNKTDGKLVAAGGPADPELCEVGPGQQEKLDSIQLECAHLLATQLAAQRRHYEDKLASEKEIADGKIKILEEQLQEAERAKNQLLKKMNNMTAKVSSLQSQLADEKAMATAAGRARDELAHRSENEQKAIQDLKEQVRDLTFFVEASASIEKRDDLQEIRGGQVLLPSSPPTNKPRSKKNRKSK